MIWPAANQVRNPAALKTTAPPKVGRDHPGSLLGQFRLILQLQGLLLCQLD